MKNLHRTLSDWWKTVQGLKPQSPAADWDAMTAYLSPDCVLFFGGMGAPASQGIEAAVTDLKKVLTYWQLLERRVLAEGASTHGRTIFAAMNNRLSILGQPVELPETEVVTFDEDGKIARYELYCDPGPIKAIFASQK
jgi:ketosteroid isomerase-like protein